MPKNAMAIAAAARMAFAVSRANILSPFPVPITYTMPGLNREMTVSWSSPEENRAQEDADAARDQQRLDRLGTDMGPQLLGILIRPFLGFFLVFQRGRLGF